MRSECVRFWGYRPGVTTLPDLLFWEGDLRAALEHNSARLKEEIENAPEQHLLQAEVEEWAEALAEKYRIEAPVLAPEKMWMDPPREVQVDVSYDSFSRALPPGGGAFYVPGYQVVVHIPFTGDKGVFQLRASTYTANPPRAVVRDGELQDVIEYPHDSPVDIKARAEQLAQTVQNHLVWSRNDIEQHNASLLQHARGCIENRRSRVQRNYEHLQATGLPMGPPDETPKTYIAEALVRRPAPVLPTALEAPIELEPVLGDEVFEHILGILRAALEAMERSPGTYEAMGEEDRRQVLLTALNTHYRGQATAEAFNVSGKTDILVRHEGKNLFIAECKFWSGAKSLSDAVQQLFGYTAWRDTKLALVMFVRERDLTAIIESGRGELEGHDQFVEWIATSETELRARMAWPGDDRRLADMNIFFVHTPPAS